MVLMMEKQELDTNVFLVEDSEIKQLLKEIKESPDSWSGEIKFYEIGRELDFNEVLTMGK